MGSDEFQFSWGRKKTIKSKIEGVQFYESFTFDHVEYALYDSVYLYKHGDPDPYIGKIIRIYDKPGATKKVRILWFFHPSEVKSYLKNEKILEKEIFLASGEGVGCWDLNPLEAIAGKCSVICTSKDQRNRQPSEEEVNRADYVFCRTFNVASCALSEEFPEIIGGVLVRDLLNQSREELRTERAENSRGKKLARVDVTGDRSPMLENNAKRRKLAEDAAPMLPTQNGGNPVKKRDNRSDDLVEKSTREKRLNESKSIFSKDEKSAEETENDDHLSKVPARVGGQGFFNPLPWEARLKNADEKGSVVYIQNLDPSYSRSDVEDIIKEVVGGPRCSVDFINHPTYDDPGNGKAYALLKTAEQADKLIEKINSGLLVDGRALICSKGVLPVVKKSTSLVGHLSTEKYWRLRKQTTDMKNAVSTSHCSQPNTIEYEMAVDWILLEAQFTRRQQELRKSQRKENEGIKSAAK